MKLNTDSESDIIQTLGAGDTSGRSKALKRIAIIGGPVLLTVVLFLYWIMGGSNNGMQQYKTMAVEQGPLTVTVTATGALEPTNTVEVGSELSGIVETVEVDYNDQVKVGQVLATLDSSRLEAQIMQSKAALESASAQVLEAKATAREAQNELERLKEVRKLSGDKVPSKRDLDAAEAALQRANAAEAIAKAQVLQAKATLDVNQTDLEKLTIRSPVDGIVLTRNVEPGQTEAAAFQTPVFFTLAEDLTKMELHVSVDEADVGLVQKGQKATFTVDAYPNRVFPAQVMQVRFGAETVQSVVTYKTLLSVDNTELVLRPGMTATAHITVKQIKNAILVPNAALRFAPPVKEGDTSDGSGSLISRLFPRPPRGPTRKEKNGNQDKSHKRVWTIHEDSLVPISISTGLTDGVMTEVISGDLKPGMALVTDVERAGP